jgi:hypothetical protein
VTAVAPSGRIDEVPVPELLLAICSSRGTGVLRIARAGTTKAIYIRKGEIIFAASTDPNDRLGELLLRREVIRLEHLETALANLQKPKRLGTVLVEMGYLEPEKLVWGVVEQAKETIFSLFTWSDGEYRFDEGELPTQEVITLKLSTQEVILGGISRIERWDRVLAGVGNLDTPHQVSPRRDRILKRIKLDEPHSALLSALEQPMSARELCRMDLLPDFQACRALWAFKVIGLVEASSGADKMLRQLAMQDEDSVASLSMAAAPAAPTRRATAAAVMEPPPETAAAAWPGGASSAAAGGASSAATGADVEDVTEEDSGDDERFSSAAASAWTPDPSDPSTMPSIPAAPKPASAAAAPRPPERYSELDPDVEPQALASRPSAAAAPAVPAPAAPAPAAPKPAAAAPPAAAPSSPAPAAAAPAVPQKEASSPGWDPDEAEISAFNDRQRRLFSLMSEKVGQQAAELVRRTLQSLGKELPGIFKGVHAADDGGVDSKGIKANVATSGAKNLTFALDLVIERELEAVAGMLGPAVRREIAGKLKGK